MPMGSHEKTPVRPVRLIKAAVLPVRSVGVQGDGRTYRHAISLFGDYLEEHRKLAVSIPNSSQEFNRVLICISQTDVPKFVFTPGYLSTDRADLLREADAIVNEEMQKDESLYRRIWQFPVVLLPFGTSEGGQSIVLRPIESTDAMTANAANLPSDILKKMVDKISAIDGIDLVFLDLTNKPPGTIEWE